MSPWPNALMGLALAALGYAPFRIARMLRRRQVTYRHAIVGMIAGLVTYPVFVGVYIFSWSLPVFFCLMFIASPLKIACDYLDIAVTKLIGHAALDGVIVSAVYMCLLPVIPMGLIGLVFDIRNHARQRQRSYGAIIRPPSR